MLIIRDIEVENRLDKIANEFSKAKKFPPFVSLT
jgi:hypothetical protein